MRGTGLRPGLVSSEEGEDWASDLTVSTETTGTRSLLSAHITLTTPPHNRQLRRFAIMTVNVFVKPCPQAP